MLTIVVLIPFESINIQKLNEFAKGTLSELLEMEVTEVSSDFLRMRMPVRAHHLQPLGLLHGGALGALAENVGSLAGSLVVGRERHIVGLSLNCNHMKSAKEGEVVFATARPKHLGSRTHVWEIEIVNEAGILINLSQLTLAVIEKK